MKTNYKAFRYVVMSRNMSPLAGFNSIAEALEFIRQAQSLGGEDNQGLILVAVLQ